MEVVAAANAAGFGFGVTTGLDKAHGNSNFGWFQ